VTDHTFVSDGGTVVIDGSVTAAAGVNLGTSQALTGTTAMTIGDNNQTVAINSSDWDIGATGDVTGLGAIGADGLITFTNATEASAVGTAAVVLSGGLGVAKDIWVGDDINMASNGAVLTLGADSPVTLTHSASTLTLAGTLVASAAEINGTITLANDETIANSTDTQIVFTSNGNEDLILDLDTATDNEVSFSSSTGVTQVNFSALNLVTTGTILGAVNVVVTTDGSESPTAAQMYGTMFIADHGTATSDTTYTLPAAAAGMSACFYDNGAGTGGITIEIDDADVIILNGTALTAGNTIDSPGVAGDGANGDFICLMAIDATNWITLGRSGTWVDGGAN
jgi:hypothetical protein